MAGIDEELAQILSARYGRDVRQSIHDAIKTCYDDGRATDVTELIEEVSEINNTLSYQLDEGYLGKNKFNKNKVVKGYYYNSSGALASQKDWGYENIEIVGGENYTITNKGSVSSNVQNVWLDSNKTFISIASSRGVESPCTVKAPSNAKFLGVSLVTNSTLNTYELDILQVERGSEATEYSEYGGKSNRELTSEVGAINMDAINIKMLGWTVPKECTIQNEVNGNQFIQRVGRVELSTLNWRKRGDGAFEVDPFIHNTATSQSLNLNGYIDGYTYDTWQNITDSSHDKIFTIYKYSSWTDFRLGMKNSAYADLSLFVTAIQGKYLYYELATPITTTIDGNEAVSKINDNLSALVPTSGNGIIADTDHVTRASIKWYKSGNVAQIVGTFTLASAWSGGQTNIFNGIPSPIEDMHIFINNYTTGEIKRVRLISNQVVDNGSLAQLYSNFTVGEYFINLSYVCK